MSLTIGSENQRVEKGMRSGPDAFHGKEFKRVGRAENLTLPE